MTEKPRKPLRLAAVIERPIPFYVPHYRSLSSDPDIDLEVIYLSDSGLAPFSYHGVRISYDVEILRGYRSIVLGRGHPAGVRRGSFDWMIPELWRVLARGAYDAVWVHGYNLPSHWLAFAACRRLELPLLLRGESELLFPRAPWKRVLKRCAFGWLFPRAAACLYIGTLNREFYRAYGVGNDRLFGVPYGVDNLWFGGSGIDERRTWRDETRRRLGLSDNTLIFVNHSKHRFPKRPADIVRAFARLDPEADAALVLVGDGDQRTEVDAAFATLRPGHRVFRLGYQTYDELRQTLVASDVLVFASEENWGMAVNEGLAAGLAVLCSDGVAGAIDMVQHGVNGFVFRSRDESELAQQMRDCIQNPDMVRFMKAASRERSRAFSFEAMNEGLRAALCAASAERRGFGSPAPSER
jgi:glycosyltransferase involved in cell wall biosynthesis